jgi:hypothetical protein
MQVSHKFVCFSGREVKGEVVSEQTNVVVVDQYHEAV